MSNEIMQETTTLVECSAFHRAMSVLEASLRNTEDSEAIINGLLKGVAEFYGASRASVLEADWELGIGVITYEWCKDGVQAQRDMLQCLPMEKFPRWRKALRANKPVMISDLQRLERVYPDEAAFFREYGVTTLLAAPFSKRINQGFIAVDDPTRYTDDPVFLFIASYAVVILRPAPGAIALREPFCILGRFCHAAVALRFRGLLHHKISKKRRTENVVSQ